MPCSSVAAQEDDVIGVLLRQFIQKDVHAIRIAIRHDQKTGVSRHRIDSAICIAVFPNMVAWYRWTDPFFAPTVFRLVDPSESGFILKHKTYLLIWVIIAVYIICQFMDPFYNFFEVSMTSSLAFFGCLLLGKTFRQPCR